jgi:hypothetical protein
MFDSMTRNKSPCRHEYINRSSILYELFSSWPNAEIRHCANNFRKWNASLYFVRKERGYIDSLQFTADNEMISWKADQVHEDICLLSETLAPGTRLSELR